MGSSSTESSWAEDASRDNWSPSNSSEETTVNGKPMRRATRSATNAGYATRSSSTPRQTKKNTPETRSASPPTTRRSATRRTKAANVKKISKIKSSSTRSGTEDPELERPTRTKRRRRNKSKRNQTNSHTSRVSSRTKATSPVRTRSGRTIRKPKSHFSTRYSNRVSKTTDSPRATSSTSNSPIASKNGRTKATTSSSNRVQTNSPNETKSTTMSPLSGETRSEEVKAKKSRTTRKTSGRNTKRDSTGATAQGSERKLDRALRVANVKAKALVGLSKSERTQVRGTHFPLHFRSPTVQRKRRRKRWDRNEVKALISGLKKYGEQRMRWKLILTDPQLSVHFNDRTTVDLKDKVRNLAKCLSDDDDDNESNGNIDENMNRLNSTEEIEDDRGGEDVSGGESSPEFEETRDEADHVESQEQYSANDDSNSSVDSDDRNEVRENKRLYNSSETGNRRAKVAKLSEIHEAVNGTVEMSHSRTSRLKESSYSAAQHAQRPDNYNETNESPLAQEHEYNDSDSQVELTQIEVVANPSYDSGAESYSDGENLINITFFGGEPYVKRTVPFEPSSTLQYVLRFAVTELFGTNADPRNFALYLDGEQVDNLAETIKQSGVDEDQLLFLCPQD